MRDAKHTHERDVLRLLFPQWQGGNNHAYAMGARMLAWLAPEGGTKTVEVPVSVQSSLGQEDSSDLFAREDLTRQFEAAAGIIEARRPGKIVVFGGDCFVSLAPFSYLRRLYGPSFGVLWIDAHPDVGTPADFKNAHTMVMGTLLGHGDPLFADRCKPFIDGRNVLFAGLKETREAYSRFVSEQKLRVVRSESLRESSDELLAWISERKIERLAIHFDLDVLRPGYFRAQSFARPDAGESLSHMAGDLDFDIVVRVIRDVSAGTDVVGLTIAEHTPWDAINLKRALAEIKILRE